MAYLEGPSILVEPIERPSIRVDVYMGSQRVDPTNTLGGDGDANTSALASTSTLAPVVFLLFPSPVSC